MLGGAALLALSAAGALTAFLVLVFSLFLPEWAAAVIVGAGLAAAGYVLVQRRQETDRRSRKAVSRANNRNG